MPYWLHSFLINLKSSLAAYPTSNAKSLACDTANEDALTCTRETCSCSQTAVQWNQWRWSIHMRRATVGTLYRQLTPPYEYECFWYCSEARNRTQQHTDSTKVFVPGWDRTFNALVSTLLSQCIIPPCSQAHIKYVMLKNSFLIAHTKHVMLTYTMCEWMIAIAKIVLDIKKAVKGFYYN